MSVDLDRQLADLTWSIATGLRAGYSLRQVFEALAAEAPEPCASACQSFLAELEKCPEGNTALVNWQQAASSAGLARLVEVLTQAGGLPDQLDPLSDELLRECGSDPAFYPAMRRQAEQLGAKTPERALNIEK
jgi:hypothetical protein